MPQFRYAQICPLARAAEIVAERWTLLIVRELLLGAWRFSDLRRRLGEASPSVLTERLESIERKGLITQQSLPRPAALPVFAKRSATSALKFVVHLIINNDVFSYHVKGGKTGTKVKEGLGVSDATVSINAEIMPRLLSGMLDLKQAEKMNAVDIEGDKNKAYQLFTLFEKPGSPKT